jgi:hypothetical protein
VEAGELVLGVTVRTILLEDIGLWFGHEIEHIILCRKNGLQITNVRSGLHCEVGKEQNQKCVGEEQKTENYSKFCIHIITLFLSL